MRGLCQIQREENIAVNNVFTILPLSVLQNPDTDYLTNTIYNIVREKKSIQAVITKSMGFVKDPR